MDYALIKAAIAAVIKENGNEEITGNILQQVLLAVIDVLGLGYQYIGIATPSTNPGTPDAKVFYIAQAQGTYSNFNDGASSPVLDGTAIGIFAFDTQWHNTILDVATKSSLAAYLKIADLAAGIGDSETTAMTQKAVTELLDGVATELGKKANKVVEGTSGNLPKLTANGDLADSDIPATDVATKQELAVATLPGLAEAVIDTDNAGTEQEFTFRKSGGDGGAYYRKIKGKTLAWNQLVETTSGSNTGVDNRGNEDCPIIVFSTNSSAFYSQVVLTPQKLSAIIDIPAGITDFAIRRNGRSIDYYLVPFSANLQTKIAGHKIYFTADIKAVDYSVFGGYQWENVGITDLTRLFNGNVPEGYTVADFKRDFPELNGGYNPGTLISNDAEAVETTGANQWDEETQAGYYGSDFIFVSDPTAISSKNKIPCKPNTEYYCQSFVPLANNPFLRVLFYDGEGNPLSVISGTSVPGSFTTPNGAALMGFSIIRYNSTYNHDICINFSNPAINGQYFPYWKRDLQLNITTRKDTDGNVPFPNGLQSCPVAQDEATKEGGTIRVGTRAYQAGDESDADVITDGTNTNYAHTTPQTFTWAEPLNLGVKVDENGTERAVAPEGATAPSAPFVADTTYTMSIARMVQKLASI